MYYVIEIATGDAKISGKSVYEYATRKEAIATFHSKMGVAMKSALYESELLMVIDKFGNTVVLERYDKPVATESNANTVE